MGETGKQDVQSKNDQMLGLTPIVIDIVNNNPINNLEPSNVMRYRGGQSSVNSEQIDSINVEKSNSQPNINH